MIISTKSSNLRADNSLFQEQIEIHILSKYQNYSGIWDDVIVYIDLDLDLHGICELLKLR